MTEEKHHEHEEHNHGHTEHHEHKEHHHEHNVHHHTEHKPKGFSIKKSAVWQITTALAVLLLIISIATGGFRGNKDTDVETISEEEASDTGVVTISEEEATQKAIAYINTNLLQPGMTATLESIEKNSIEEDSGIYSMNISVGGVVYTSFITQDGKYLFTSGVDMTEEEIEPETEVVKSDKPEVELFVMSHCPYGTQAEKGIIPAVKALGNNIDFKLRFVYYAMHPTQGEVEEQLNQYCIQEEQNDKFLDYLECFLTEGDGEGCIESTGIDEDKLDACVEAVDEEFEITANLEDESLWLNGRYPKFSIDAELNTKYGVGGSPTLVVNNVRLASSENNCPASAQESGQCIVYPVARDSASYLGAICDAFNEAPEACNTELSSASPSPGFGYTTTSGASTTAQCG